jgi:Zn-dependent M28 family amino/carboxypeptidase
MVARADTPGAPLFNAGQAMVHVRVLAVDIGMRPGGSAAERKAVDYVAGQLQGWGYQVHRQTVPLPNGRTTHNVVAEEPGVSEGPLWILGAHLDSKPPSPGANDNATGVASVLEIARIQHGVHLSRGSMRYVLFGCEERIDSNPDHHHFGSRAYVRSIHSDERKRLAGVVIIDSTGAGAHFAMGSVRGSSLARDMAQFCNRKLARIETMRDPGWSDHEPFEKAGFPACYVRWRIDPTLHTRGDDYAHVQPWKVTRAARAVLEWLRQPR